MFGRHGGRTKRGLCEGWFGEEDRSEVGSVLSYQWEPFSHLFFLSASQAAARPLPQCLSTSTYLGPTLIGSVHAVEQESLLETFSHRRHGILRRAVENGGELKMRLSAMAVEFCFKHSFVLGNT